MGRVVFAKADVDGHCDVRPGITVRTLCYGSATLMTGHRSARTICPAA